MNTARFALVVSACFGLGILLGAFANWIQKEGEIRPEVGVVTIANPLFAETNSAPQTNSVGGAETVVTKSSGVWINTSVKFGFKSDH